MSRALFQARFPVVEYDLAATLDSGQAFRWEPHAGGWEGIIHGRWVRLEALAPDGGPADAAPSPAGAVVLQATTAADPGDWHWLRSYLALDDDPGAIRATFPADAELREAVARCRGLRVLRQDPWECLASFILSSTKQIVQIRQIVRRVSECFGEPVAVPAGAAAAWSFPTPSALAAATEADLRACKMGFRAPYLLETARAVAEGRVNLDALAATPLEEARARLMELPGVGRKIADCALLFGLGFPAAFPVDVWVLRVLRELYFPRRPPKPARLLHFSETHFGPYGGHAQQYLFHWRRLRAGRVANAPPLPAY